jgi:hypothetical protein
MNVFRSPISVQVAGKKEPLRPPVSIWYFNQNVVEEPHKLRGTPTSIVDSVVEQPLQRLCICVITIYTWISCQQSEFTTDDHDMYLKPHFCCIFSGIRRPPQPETQTVQATLDAEHRTAAAGPPALCADVGDSLSGI